MSFREYLKNELERRMVMNSSYSMRAFARDLKIPASRMSELLSARAGVSIQRVDQIIDCLKLSASEAQYVRDIAVLEFSHSELVKDQALKRIADLNKHIIQMTAQDFEEISDWYYFAIMELVSKVDITADFSELGKKIGIQSGLCEFAVGRLLRKGLIINQDGFLKSTHKRISVIGEPKESIQKFHHQFVSEAIKSFATCDFIEREFSSSFAMLTDDEIQTLRKQIRSTVELTFNEIIEKRKHLKAHSNHQLKLYGLGVQLFPLKLAHGTLKSSEMSSEKSSESIYE